MENEMILGLRKINGVSISEFEKRFRINPLFYFRFEISKLEEKDFNRTPNVKLKEYKLSYLNRENNDNYIIEGHSLNIEKNSNTPSLAFGDNQTEAYFAYYLEHSTEIVEWMNKDQIIEETVMSFR